MKRVKYLTAKQRALMTEFLGLRVAVDVLVHRMIIVRMATQKLIDDPKTDYVDRVHRHVWNQATAKVRRCTTPGYVLKYPVCTNQDTGREV